MREAEAAEPLLVLRWLARAAAAAGLLVRVTLRAQRPEHRKTLAAAAVAGREAQAPQLPALPVGRV